MQRNNQDRNSREAFFELLRAALRQQTPDIGTLAASGWDEVYRLASQQGVLAIVWDAVRELAPERMPPRELKIRWSLNAEQIEKLHEKQRGLIARLAAFYDANGIEMMLIKGHGLGRCYPVPEHRPCGDIDIWLFGEQKRADTLMRTQWGVRIDEDKHHHTTFVLDGVLVENHYDFVNIHAIASNRLVERHLQRYAREQGERIGTGAATILLPGANFNALFLLRHAAMHFAAEKIGMRHVADWALFCEKYAAKIDWTEICGIVRELNMHRFMHALNAVSVDYLGTDPALLPPIERDPELERRVLEEILAPEFGETLPEGTILRVVWFKFRRWWVNRWKHRIVYREGLFPAFVRSSWSHLLKPRTITH